MMSAGMAVCAAAQRAPAPDKAPDPVAHGIFAVRDLRYPDPTSPRAAPECGDVMQQPSRVLGAFVMPVTDHRPQGDTLLLCDEQRMTCWQGPVLARAVDVAVPDATDSVDADLVEPARPSDCYAIIRCRVSDLFFAWRKPFATEGRKHCETRVTSSATTSVRLYSPQLDLLHSAECPHPVFSCVDNPITGEIVCFGRGELSVWHAKLGRQLEMVVHRGMTLGRPPDPHPPLFFPDLDDCPPPAQRLTVTCGNRILVDECASATETTRLHEIVAHNRPISACLIDVQLAITITGARDGSVKVWDAGWDVEHSWRGHKSDVTGLLRFPFDRKLLSCSRKGQLFLWNLVTGDVEASLDLGLPCHGLGTLMTSTRFYSQHADCLRLWKVWSLHRDLVEVGQEVTTLMRTEQGEQHPARLVAMHGGVVRLLSPVSGLAVTTGRLPAAVQMAAGTGSSARVIDYTYSSAALDTLVVVTADGAVRAFDTSTNPMTLGTPLDLGPDRMAGSVCVLCSLPSSVSLCAVGCNDGAVVLVDLAQSIVLATSEAVHPSAVTKVHETKDGVLLSFSADGFTQAWVVGPEGPTLYKLDAWFCGGATKFVKSTNCRICVVSVDEASGMDRVAMFNARPKQVFEHLREDDHKHAVTGLSACSSLHIFATTCLGGVIKIWSERCDLLRQLELYDPITASCFRQCGQLVIGILKNLHTVPVEALLPEDHRQALDALNPRPLQREEPIVCDSADAPQDKQLDLIADAVARRREQIAAAAAAREATLRRLAEEHAAKQAAVQEREAQAQRVLESRHNCRDELAQKVRKGTTVATMQNYMRAIGAGRHQADALRRAYDISATMELKQGKNPDLERLVCTVGSFPEGQDGPSKSLKAQLVGELRTFPEGVPVVAPDGFIPNSKVWHLMGGRPPDDAAGSVWQLRELDDEQRQAAQDAVLSSKTDTDGLLDVENENGEPAPETPPPARATRQKKVATGGFKPLKTQEKPKPKTPEPEPEREPTPEPEERQPTPEPEPPRTPTPPQRPPLPGYVSLCRGDDWFESNFPRARPALFDALRPKSDGGEQNQDHIQGQQQLQAQPAPAWPQVPVDAWLALLYALSPHHTVPSGTSLKEILACPLRDKGRRGILFTLGRQDEAAQVVQVAKALSERSYIPDDHREMVATAILAKIAETKPLVHLPPGKALLSATAQALPALNEPTVAVVAELLSLQGLGDQQIKEQVHCGLEVMGLRDPKHLLTDPFDDIASKFARELPEKRHASLRRAYAEFVQDSKSQCAIAASTLDEEDDADDPCLAFAKPRPNAIEALNFWVASETERLRRLHEKPKTPPPVKQLPRLRKAAPISLKNRKPLWETSEIIPRKPRQGPRAPVALHKRLKPVELNSFGESDHLLLPQIGSRRLSDGAPSRSFVASSTWVSSDNTQTNDSK
eukprot:m.375166 g.375166  ORF g.375166 m.375166 type:complete len:1424 (-) comp20007_c0_seq11:248-4519(-)